LIIVSSQARTQVLVAGNESPAFNLGTRIKARPYFFNAEVCAEFYGVFYLTDVTIVLIYNLNYTYSDDNLSDKN